MINTPNKAGQIVKFRTPLEDENPEQQYVVTEIHLHTERPRAQIQALNTGLPFPPSMSVFVETLEEVAVSTHDLIGYTAAIRKPDGSITTGKIISVESANINLDLTIGLNSIETNVWVKVLDSEGNEQTGKVFVNE